MQQVSLRRPRPTWCQDWAPAHLPDRGGGERRCPPAGTWVGCCRGMVATALQQVWDLQQPNVMLSGPLEARPERNDGGWRMATLEPGAGIRMQGRPHMVE